MEYIRPHLYYREVKHMLYQARNETLRWGERSMEAACFGQGRRVLVLLPGLGDGLRTVKGSALSLAWLYRACARQYRVLVFSRIDQLPDGYTTQDMARDVALALDALQIERVSVLGVSQGGMIAQYVALDHPARVERLVLAVSAARPNPLLEQAVSTWIAQAQQGDYSGLLRDTAERSYSAAYLRRRRWLLQLLGQVGRPRDFRRFLIQARSCLSHNAYDRLAEITAPTLLIGGGQDKIVGPQALPELAAAIHGSQSYLYPDFGHAVYEEAADFNQRVLDFLA